MKTGVPPGTVVLITENDVKFLVVRSERREVSSSYHEEHFLGRSTPLRAMMGDRMRLMMEFEDVLAPDPVHVAAFMAAIRLLSGEGE